MKKSKSISASITIAFLIILGVFFDGTNLFGQLPNNPLKPNTKNLSLPTPKYKVRVEAGNMSMKNNLLAENVWGYVALKLATYTSTVGGNVSILPTTYVSTTSKFAKNFWNVKKPGISFSAEIANPEPIIMSNNPVYIEKEFTADELADLEFQLCTDFNYSNLGTNAKYSVCDECDANSCKAFTLPKEYRHFTEFVNLKIGDEFDVDRIVLRTHMGGPTTACITTIFNVIIRRTR